MASIVGRSESLWFLDTLVTIRIPFSTGTDGISLLEHRAHQGDSPPLHVHTTEDEVFHVLEGELLLVVGVDRMVAAAGESVLVPKGAAHTYRVESASGARWLTVSTGGDFERFVRALGRTPEAEGLPGRGGPPSPDDAERLARIARDHGIELVGPPLS